MNQNIVGRNSLTGKVVMKGEGIFETLTPFFEEDLVFDVNGCEFRGVLRFEREYLNFFKFEVFFKDVVMFFKIYKDEYYECSLIGKFLYFQIVDLEKILLK